MSELVCESWHAYGKEEVGNVVRNVHGNANVREVEAVAEPDQRDGDDVVRDQLLKVLARLLQHQEQNNGLLGPVAGLQEVVRLEHGLVRAVREAFVHAGRVEVPHRAAAHDPETERSRKSKVQRRVCLLHEPALLGAALDAAGNCDGTDEALHAELTREAQDDDIECDKCEVARALAVVRGRIGVCSDGGGDQRIVAWKRVREEQTGCNGIRGMRVDSVERDDGEQEDERQQPCVSYACALEFGETAADGAALRAPGLV